MLEIHVIEEHQAHPKIRMIPWVVWQTVFDEFVNEAELARMTDSLMDATKKDKFTVSPLKELLAFIYTHPQASVKTLAQVVEATNISRSDLIKAALISGKTAFFEQLNSPLELMEAVFANDFEIFRIASQANVLIRNELFRLVCLGNYLPAVMDLFERTDSAQRVDMIIAEEYEVFYLLYDCGYYELIETLFTFLTPEQKKCMVRSVFYEVYRTALDKLNYETIYRLAELVKDDPENELCIGRFIELQIDSLKKRRDQVGSKSANGVFDLDSPQDCRNTFFLARQLILRNNIANQDDLQFILTIPKIQSMAAAAITSGQPNELLVLALTCGCYHAAGVLFTIPEVRKVARDNDYYQNMPGKLFSLMDTLVWVYEDEGSGAALVKGSEYRFFTPANEETSIEKGRTGLEHEQANPKSSAMTCSCMIL